MHPDPAHRLPSLMSMLAGSHVPGVFLWKRASLEMHASRFHWCDWSGYRHGWARGEPPKSIWYPHRCRFSVGSPDKCPKLFLWIDQFNEIDMGYLLCLNDGRTSYSYNILYMISVFSITVLEYATKVIYSPHPVLSGIWLCNALGCCLQQLGPNQLLYVKAVATIARRWLGSPLH